MTPIDRVESSTSRLSLVTQEFMDEAIRNLLAELPWPLPPHTPPTRWQRIKSAPRRAKARVLGAVHDRFFSDYCDCSDY